MKAAFVGGGSFRLMGILREALSVPGLFDGGEIYLHDLDEVRAEAMGRMIMKTPEYAKVRCRVRWGNELQPALEGADAVGVIFLPGSRKCFDLGEELCRHHGFLGSDNISPSAAFNALKGGEVVLNVAREMEKYCPNALLLDFANPISVLSGAVNLHTKIKALGVCQGFTNHQWDLSRALLGKDEQNTDFHVETAGINHVCFIQKGSYLGEDVLEMMKKCLDPSWKMAAIQSGSSPASRALIENSVARLVEIYRRFGVILYSTEPEGLWHLRYEQALEENLKNRPLRTDEQVLARTAEMGQSRHELNQKFQALSKQDLDESFWNGKDTDGMYKPTKSDIFVQILKGIKGPDPVRIVTSRPNQGAVAGFKDRTILEYSQIIENGVVRAEGHYELPDVVQGVVGALATHQTMLADAVGTHDPRLLAHALLAYPIQAFSNTQRALYRDLLKLNSEEILPVYRKVADYL